MPDFNEYLIRIGFSGKPKANLTSLKSLHIRHLLSVPFENLDIHYGRKIILEPSHLFGKIVINKRGGFCYELNGLFYELLISAGFEAIRVSARVYDTSEPGPEFDHMAILVKINDESWLADVGFGDSFLKPLKFEPGLIQQQNGKFYEIERMDDDNFRVTVSSDGENFSNMYRFSLIPRDLIDFNTMCEYHQTSPDSHFTQKRICTIAQPGGRITLSGMKFIKTNNGTRTETELKSDIEFNEILKDQFGIELNS